MKEVLCLLDYFWIIIFFIRWGLGLISWGLGKGVCSYRICVGVEFLFDSCGVIVGDILIG